MTTTRLRAAVANETLSQATARRIRGLMAERRLSGSEVARALGMNQQSFSRRTTGTTPLTLDELEPLAEVLGESVFWLLTGQRTAPHPVEPDEGLVVRREGLEPPTR